MENGEAPPPKVKLELLMGVSPKGLKSDLEAIFALLLLQARVTMDGQAAIHRDRSEKVWPVPTMECCSDLKRKETLAQATAWTDCEAAVPSEISQSPKAGHCVGFRLEEASKGVKS